MIEMIHRVNALALFMFCVFYSYVNPRLDVVMGILVSAGALFLLYIPYMITYPPVPEEKKRSEKKYSIIAGWSFALFFLGMLARWRLMEIMGLVLLVPYALHFAYDLIEWKKNLHGEMKSGSEHRDRGIQERGREETPPNDD